MTNLNINWYPGHMKKTMDNIKSSLKLVDVVLEIVDARIPIASRNPLLDEVVGDKPRVVLLNKMDLGDENKNKEWLYYFKSKGYEALLIDSVKGTNLNKIENISRQLLTEKFKKLEEKNLDLKRVRAMIVGIPNVGKSTLINRIAKRKSAKVGNRPGVTRQNQWIKTGKDFELLDTPGVLWPKFESEEIGLDLAFTGAIKDEIMDVETLAFKLIEKLNHIDKDIIENRYKIETTGLSTLEIMELIGKKRGCLIKGGDFDYEKISNIVLDEFRKGVLGRITLEGPDDYNG
ncbi:ribosome biogenesis GTPase YlqF [Lagierella massiliensis]|uniref:ribosome biogenesis GTPase YlqF n=1 Tax=Lagierella massiliensis TaxID=1689303 RepID=UPI0006D7B061|nr:ribosome biogenesis GTPase YlqF [Lagierella massiliensis]